MTRLRFTTKRGAIAVADELAERFRDVHLPLPQAGRDFWHERVRDLLGAYLCLAAVDRVCGRTHRVTMRTIEAWVTSKATVDDPDIRDLVELGLNSGDEAGRMARHAHGVLWPLHHSDKVRSAIYTFTTATLGLEPAS